MNEKYNKDLLNKIAFYRCREQYLPFIGENYDEKRILIASESHYLEEGAKHLSPEDWYEGKAHTFDANWYNTRGVVEGSKDVENNSIFQIIRRGLKEAGIGNGQNPLDCIAFMNTFQRPAIHGQGIELVDLDIEKAIEVFNAVTAIIKPKFVCFVSSLAWDKVGQRLDFESKDYAPHPTHEWWNTKAKKYGNRTGKQKFIDCIQEHCK